MRLMIRPRYPFVARWRFILAVPMISALAIGIGSLAWPDAFGTIASAGDLLASPWGRVWSAMWLGVAAVCLLASILDSMTLVRAALGCSALAGSTIISAAIAEGLTYGTWRGLVFAGIGAYVALQIVLMSFSLPVRVQEEIDKVDRRNG